MPETPPPRRRRARNSISPDAIVKVAFELAEQGSVDSVTLPRIAEKLDVAITSLYWYFRGKEDLLDAMTDIALVRFNELLPPLTDEPWDVQLTSFFTSFRQIFREDRLLCDLIIMRSNRHNDRVYDHAWTHVERMIGTLVRAGFSRESAAHAYLALSVYTRGCLMIERMGENTPPTRGTAPPYDPLVLAGDASTSTTYPQDVQETHALMMAVEDDFEFGLTNTIRGLRQLLSGQSTQPVSTTTRKP
ncbi:TetR/AcrR family transcriptional regulator [Jatrophihabitans sp. DSM 45814]